MLPERVIAYDTLVFCVGSVNNDFGIPGVAERAISLDEPGDAFADIKVPLIRSILILV